MIVVDWALVQRSSIRAPIVFVVLVTIGSDVDLFMLSIRPCVLRSTLARTAGAGDIANDILRRSASLCLSTLV